VKSLAMDAEPSELTFGRILRRLPLYLGLAVAGLTAATILLTLCIHFGITGYATGGWIGFIGYTGLLFWVILRQSRPHWYRRMFWLSAVWLLMFHCFIFVTILKAYPQWRMIWFWPITVIEGGVIGGMFEWLFPEKHTRHRRPEKL